MKPRHWIFVAAVGAALTFHVDAEARPRLFKRFGGGGGGGGGTLSIDPDSLPAGYYQQATAIQQGAACNGPYCTNPTVGFSAQGYAVPRPAAPAGAVAVAVQRTVNPAPQQTFPSPAVDAAATAFAEALAKKLGIEIQAQAEPANTMAAVLDTLPKVRLTIEGRDGQVQSEAMIDLASHVREQIGESP